MHFAVWAPNAQRVSVVGDFNGWDGRVHPMRAVRPGGSGRSSCPIWARAIRYKFEVVGADGQRVLKADPCGRYFETPPRTASIVWSGDKYEWGRGVDDDARGQGHVASPADVGLRSAPWQLATRHPIGPC